MSEVAINGVNTHSAVKSDVVETTPGEPASFELRILEAKQMRVFRHTGITRLTLNNERSWRKVSVARAFPLSDPDHYLGFLDGSGKDVGMLHDPAALDPESKKTVDEELEKRYFVPIVEKAISVKEEFGTVYWTLDTDRGQREVIVRNMRDNLQELSPIRVIITDVDGNRFEFQDITKLDAKSYGLILRNL